MSLFRFSKTKRNIRAWLKRKKIKHVNVTSDELWNKIKSVPKLDEEEREVLFQQMGKLI